MGVLIFLISSILIGHVYGGMILHNIRDSLHSKFYGHGLHGENSNQNSPIININNHQEMAQQSLTHTNQGYNQQMGSGYGYGVQQSIGSHHSRGDHGSLSNFGPHSAYGGSGSGFMNTNIKAGGLKYGGYDGGMMGGYGSHSSMKQESYNHRQGPKFGQHHDTNIFGNTKIGSSSAASSSSSTSSSASSSASSSTSSSAGGSSSAASSSSSSSSSGSVGDGGKYFNTRVNPWRYPRNPKF